MEKELRTVIDKVASLAHELVVSKRVFSNDSLEDAIEASGIDVKYFVDKNIDGFLKWDAEQQSPVIAVNANQPETRRNFSMAHELGHLILDWKWLPYGNNDNSRFDKSKVLNVTLYRGGTYSQTERKEETNVNEFAAAFLMPNFLLKELVDGIENNEISYSDALYELKKKSNVYMMSAGYRLKNYCEAQGIDITDEQ